MFPTAEHYMMAEKARLFGDSAILAEILATEDPRAAKALGRRVMQIDAARRDEAAFAVVVVRQRGEVRAERIARRRAA